MTQVKKQQNNSLDLEHSFAQVFFTQPVFLFTAMMNEYCILVPCSIVLIFFFEFKNRGGDGSVVPPLLVRHHGYTSAIKI